MDDDLQILRFGFGRVSSPNTAMHLFSFLLKPPFSRSSAVTAGRSISGSFTRQLYGEIENYGVLNTAQSEHRNGVVLLLQSSWKRGGVSLRDGAVFLRARAQAPDYRIFARVPMDPQNRIGERVLVFAGRADILSADEVNELGFAVSSGYIAFHCDQEEVDECFEVEEVSPGAPMPQLRTVIVGGEERVVHVAPAKSRRLRFGRAKK